MSDVEAISRERRIYMRQLISETINNKLDEIVTKCFEGNRIADRGMSVLSVKFVMPKTEKFLHDKLAHLYPHLADLVSAYQSSRNNLTIYGLTPEDKTDYVDPLEFFDRMVQYMMELEALISEGMHLSRDEDCTTFSFLSQFILEVSKVTAQCLLLSDKASQYNGEWHLFDHNIKDAIII